VNFSRKLYRVAVNAMTARPSRRTLMKLAAGSLLGAPLIEAARAQARTVYVNSYGGVWESSWKKAFFEPFTAETKIQVKAVPGVSFAKLKAQVQSRNFE
jgi:putative spermidine/putrescine transport system substrate-binding protein